MGYVEFALFLMDIKADYLLAATQLNAAHKLSPRNTEITELLRQATQYCANMQSDDSADSDTIVTLSAEESDDGDRSRHGALLDDLRQIEFEYGDERSVTSLRK